VPEKESLAASVRAREKAAREASLAGDFGQGVDLLAELLVETKDPTHAYNQGRCFEQNRRYEDHADYQGGTTPPFGFNNLAETNRSAKQEHRSDAGLHPHSRRIVFASTASSAQAVISRSRHSPRTWPVKPTIASGVLLLTLGALVFIVLPPLA
jgi:hypothetical protein